MRRDEKQIQGGPEESTGNGEECRSPRPPDGIVISCGVRLSGQAAHKPLKWDTPCAIKVLPKAINSR